jgi:hypothetical protein
MDDWSARFPGLFARRFEGYAAAWLRVHDPEHADVLLLAEALGLLSA